MHTNTTLSKGSWIRLHQRQAARAGILLLLLLTLPAVVQAQFNYTINNGTVTITGYTGPGGAVTIPDTINGLPVVGIGDYAFWGASAGLTSVTIPNSVTSIGRGPFASCTGLIAITVDALNPAYSSVGGVLFNKSQTTLMQCPGGKAGNYTIPNSVVSIGESAFYGASLASITVPNGVTSIGCGAFTECHQMTSVTIPNSVTDIGDAAFYDCTGLTSVTIGNKVTSIADRLFQGCNSLTNVTIPNSVTNIGDTAFFQCSGLTNVTIPNSVTSIGWQAFAYCTSLSAITVDTNNPVFSSVAGVLLNKSQTTLIQFPGGKADGDAIPNSVTGIGDWAFAYCRLTSVTIPNSITGIGDWAFVGCTNLTSVTIPCSVTSLGFAAFEYCTNLTSITIPGSVTSMGNEAFSDCYGLTNVTLAYGVTKTWESEFYCCTSLTSVAIPDSVTSIGNSTFNQCSSLTSITIPNSVTNIGAYAFIYCTSLTNITIGNSVATIGDWAFYSCPSLTCVTIPNSVTSIGEWAFNSCPSLTGVHFNGDAPSLGGSHVFGMPATIYYLPGTTGWGTTFGGRPTVLWNPPTIQTTPQTQTAEAGSAVGLRVDASGSSPLLCVWYLNSTNLISCSTSCELDLTNLQLSQSGAYTVVISNVFGAVTSAPALLNVIAAVERRPVPGVKVTGGTASLWNLDYADSLNPAPNWTTLGSVSLTSTPQYCFDVTLPLPTQRFYRAWQTGTPGVRPSLDLHLVPAITLTGTIGHSVRLDYINQFGPTDAWVPLATVPLTNTSQLYFDVSAPGQPQRLYRVVQMP